MSDISEVIGAMSTDTKPPSLSLFDTEIAITELSEETIKDNLGQEKKVLEEDSPTNPSDTAPGVIDAKTAIAVADMLLSRVMTLTAKYMDLDASVSDFALSANEKKTLEPICGVLIQKYLPILTPEMQLGIIVVSIYGAKLLMLNKITPEKKAALQARKEGVTGKGRGRPPGSTNKPKE